MKRLIAAAFCLASTPAAATDWKLVGKTEKADYFIDVSTIRHTGRDIVMFWEKVEYHSLENGVVHSTIVLYKADCVDRKYGPVEFTDYTKDDEVYYTGTVSDAEFKYKHATPESLGEGLMNAVCPLK